VIQAFLRRLLGRSQQPRVVRGDPARAVEVEAVLRQVRPSLKADGGDLRLLAVEDSGAILLSAHGSCKGCGAALLTVQGGLAPKLRERLDWFQSVRVVE
jgi:Fe-S cluster biogenesis protein NfuA